VSRVVFSACLACSALIVVTAGCGQKGPPLPPVVRTPAPPVIHADRRGSTIELALSVPSANVDGSRPANLARIDVYAVNGPATNLTDDEIVRLLMTGISRTGKPPRPPMPQFRMTRGDAEAVLTYLKSLPSAY